MRFLPFLLLLICFTSCKSSKNIKERSNVSNSYNTYKSKTNKKNSLAENIVETAKSFSGTKYKYGGETKKGMDCSGLIFTSFKSEDILLPRVSRNMATKGKRIRLNEVKKGDLLFFKTGKNKRAINHVGLVVEVTRNSIKFIHSTSSKGVITSSLSESYWNNSFVEARHVL